MSRPFPLARAAAALVLATGLLAACANDAADPAAAKPQFAANSNSNGAVLFEFSFGQPFGVVMADAEHGLALYYRWDNGFCGGVAASDFVETTVYNVQQVDEWWHQKAVTDGAWFYVYPWDGTARINCAFLKNTTPLATGRGHKMVLDNDFFPWDPYAPGPGANAYTELYRGLLTTPAGAPADFSGKLHITVAADGQTWRTSHFDLRLSPDPR